MRFGLLTEPPADQRIVAKILSGIAPGWWVVQDDGGHKYRVAGSGLYRKGDQVAIIGNQIIGPAGTTATATVHEV